MSSGEHCSWCKKYVCVCVCAAPPEEKGFLIVSVCMGACVPVRLASLPGRAPDWAADTHTHKISKRTFDVGGLYLAESSGRTSLGVTISKRRHPQCLSIFSPLYVGHNPALLICENGIASLKNPVFVFRKVDNDYLQRVGHSSFCWFTRIFVLKSPPGMFQECVELTKNRYACTTLSINMFCWCLWQQTSEQEVRLCFDL